MGRCAQKYEKARQNHMSNLKRGCNRRDGSARQDLIHEGLMEQSRQQEREAENEYEAQKSCI